MKKFSDTLKVLIAWKPEAFAIDYTQAEAGIGIEAVIRRVKEGSGEDHHSRPC